MASFGLNAKFNVLNLDDVLVRCFFPLEMSYLSKLLGIWHGHHDRKNNNNIYSKIMKKSWIIKNANNYKISNSILLFDYGDEDDGGFKEDDNYIILNG